MKKTIERRQENQRPTVWEGTATLPDLNEFCQLLIYFTPQDVGESRVPHGNDKIVACPRYLPISYTP